MPKVFAMMAISAIPPGATDRKAVSNGIPALLATTQATPKQISSMLIVTVAAAKSILGDLAKNSLVIC